jgi:hydrophobe/amphiphile efflux-3 (HAE3) family protein
VWVLIGAVAVSALAVLGVVGIEIVTTQDTFVSAESQEFLDGQAYEQEFGGDALVVLVPATPEVAASPEMLGGFRELHAQLAAEPKIHSVVSAMTLLEPLAQQAGVDLTVEGVAYQLLFDSTGEPRPEVARFFPPGHALAVVRLEGQLDGDGIAEATQITYEAVMTDSLPDGTIVAGTPRLVDEITTSIESDLARTGAVALGLMVLVLLLVFRARWRLLSLPVVLVGVLWTFGVAGAVGIPLTFVTMAGLPVLIGLGVDFAVQFHNRYEEEMRRGDTPGAALIDAIIHIGPAVSIAVAATILGFVTLVLSAVPAVRQFGVLLAIGAVLLYLAALFVLNAVLYRFDKKPAGFTDAAVKSRAGSEHHLARWLGAVARWSRRHAVVLLPVLVVLAVAGFVSDAYLPVQTSVEELIPEGTPGVIALEEAREILGGTSELPFLVETDDITDPEVLTWMSTFQAEAVARFPEILAADSLATLLGLQPGSPPPAPETIDEVLGGTPPDIWSQVINGDRTAGAIVFQMAEVPIADVERIIDDVTANAEPPAGVTIRPAGTLTLAAAAIGAVTQRRELIALVGIGAVFLGLLVIYRKWRRAIAPIAPIVLVTGWSSGIMWLTGIDLNPLTAVLGVLIIGIGTEFTVLLTERYEEERNRGADPSHAMDLAVRRIGEAITVSGLTVAAGFGALIFSSFPVLHDFGIVIVLDLILALAATIVVVPPFVVWLDRRPTPINPTSNREAAEEYAAGINSQPTGKI